MITDLVCESQYAAWLELALKEKLKKMSDRKKSFAEFHLLLFLFLVLFHNLLLPLPFHLLLNFSQEQFDSRVRKTTVRKRKGKRKREKNVNK